MSEAATRSRRRLTISLLVATGGVAAVLAVVVALALWRPAFYAPAGGSDFPEPHREQAARRLVTALASLQASLGRVGRWEVVIADEEVNAWLDLDLPRNHPGVLPSGIRRPHVSFQSKGITIGFEAGYGIASAVVWADVEVVLRKVNQGTISIREAGVGLVPMPRGLLLEEIGRRLAPTGVVSELRRVDGEPVLLVYIPAIQGGGLTCRLEGLRIEGGEIVAEGSTRRAGDGRSEDGRAADDGRFQSEEGTE